MGQWCVGDFCDACVKVIKENPGAICEVAVRLPDGKMCLGFCCRDFKPDPFPDLPADFPRKST